MVIINGTAHNELGLKMMGEAKVYLYETLNRLKCPNDCKIDFLIRLQWVERKKDIQAQIYGACCKDFEKEVNPYLRPFLK